jgi:hypothetical protein
VADDVHGSLQLILLTVVLSSHHPHPRKIYLKAPTANTNVTLLSYYQISANPTSTTDSKQC